MKRNEVLLWGRMSGLYRRALHPDRYKMTKNYSEELPKTPQGNDSLLKLAREQQLSLSGFEEVTLERDGNLPIRFEGCKVGRSKERRGAPVGTHVDIYVTRSRKLVVSVYQWQRRGDNHRERRMVSVHQDPQEALRWLMEDGGGKLGKASCEAWTEACRTFPPLQGMEVEVID